MYHQHGLSYLTDFQMRSLIQRPSFYFAQKYAHLVFVVSDETSTNNYAATHANMTKAHYQQLEVLLISVNLIWSILKGR